jgi:hypothetical protein
MRSPRSDVDVRATIDRPKTLGLCGFGGTLRPAPPNLESAIDSAAEQYDVGLADRVGRFAAVEVGSFVWTRDPDMLSWLGRIEGPWLYDAREQAATDLVHVRACRWLSSPLVQSEVPAPVVATSGHGGLNFQPTHSRAVGPDTQRIWTTTSVAEATSLLAPTSRVRLFSKCAEAANMPETSRIRRRH